MALFVGSQKSRTHFAAVKSLRSLDHSFSCWQMSELLSHSEKEMTIWIEPEMTDKLAMYLALNPFGNNLPSIRVGDDALYIGNLSAIGVEGCVLDELDPLRNYETHGGDRKFPLALVPKILERGKFRRRK